MVGPSRAILSLALVLGGLLSATPAAAQGPWRPELEDVRLQPYAPYRARPGLGAPAAVPDAVAPLPGLTGAPPLPGAQAPGGSGSLLAPPAGRASPNPLDALAPAQAGRASYQQLLSAVPRMRWLPGLPSAPGAFDNGFLPPEPMIRRGDLQACVAGLADAVSYQLAGLNGAGVLVAGAARRACPDVPEIAIVLGMLQLLSHQTRAAVATLEGAYGRGPRAADALTLMGIWCLFLGDNHGGRQNLEEALTKDPEAWRARLALATLLHKQVDPRAGAQQAEALARRPVPVRSVLDLDLLDLTAWAQELLLDATRRLHPDCSPCRRTGADVAAHLAGLRQGLSSVRRWEQAIQLLEGTVDKHPEDADNRIALGRALGYVSEFERAASVYERGLATGDQRFVLLYGRSLLDQERSAEALPHLWKAAHETEPQRAEAWYLLGTAERILGRRDAVTSLRRAVELEPRRAVVLSDLGQTLQSHGLTTESLDAYRRALELEPLLRQARYGLAMALMELGRQDEAREQLDKYRRVLDAFQRHLTNEERSNNLDSEALRGLDDLGAGAIEGAQAAFAHVLAANPRHALAQLGMAGVLLRRQRRRQAWQHLTGMLEASAGLNAFIRSREEAAGTPAPPGAASAAGPPGRRREEPAKEQR